jgi:hypothetical protein
MLIAMITPVSRVLSAVGARLARCCQFAALRYQPRHSQQVRRSVDSMRKKVFAPMLGLLPFFFTDRFASGLEPCFSKKSLGVTRFVKNEFVTTHSAAAGFHVFQIKPLPAKNSKDAFWLRYLKGEASEPIQHVVP